jgi:hypothetical protein
LHDAPSITSTPASEAKPILKKTTEGNNKSETLPVNVGTVSADNDESYTLLQIDPITIESDGKMLDTFGFLDPGSQKTLILDRSSERLDLDGVEETTTLGTFHGEDPVIKIKKVKFSIQPRDGNRSFPVKKAFSVPKINVSAQQIEWPVTERDWSYLKDVDLPSIDASDVTILIGRDFMRVHDVLAHRSPPDGIEAPDGILTYFGCSIAGPVPESMLKQQEEQKRIDERQCYEGESPAEHLSERKERSSTNDAATERALITAVGAHNSTSKTIETISKAVATPFKMWLNMCFIFCLCSCIVLSASAVFSSGWPPSLRTHSVIQATLLLFHLQRLCFSS